jgi:hypothetical protein
MKVLFLETPLLFSLVPRHYPISTDVLTLVLRNENTNAVLIPLISFTIDKTLVIEVLEQPTDFKTQNKYEVTLLNGLEIIYKGKLIVLEAGTDIQNYNYGSQTTSKYQYK